MKASYTQQKPRKSKMKSSLTDPENVSKRPHKLPPLHQNVPKSNSVSASLTKTNIGLHNDSIPDGAAGPEKMDLDQTTMIGSALDLDSLSGGDEVDEEDIGNNRETAATSSSHAGSQVGLLKLSAV